jgi:hypothetical protein
MQGCILWSFGKAVLKVPKDNRKIGEILMQKWLRNMVMPQMSQNIACLRRKITMGGG